MSAALVVDRRPKTNGRTFKDIIMVVRMKGVARGILVAVRALPIAVASVTTSSYGTVFHVLKGLVILQRCDLLTREVSWWI